MIDVNNYENPTDEEQERHFKELEKCCKCSKYNNYERVINSRSVEEVAELIDEAWDYVIDSELTDMEEGIKKWLSL